MARKDIRTNMKDRDMRQTLQRMSKESVLDLGGGGTGSDLSATGPGVVVQASSGAPLTVESQLAHERGGLEADLSAYAGLIKILGGVTSEIKCNFSASAAPTAGDDSGDGYVVGSFWLDTTNDKAYVCLDNTLTAAVWKEISPASTGVETLNFIVDGGGTVISTGIKGDIVVDFACTINQVTMLADQSGSIVVDIWKDTYANFAPTDADSITASATPTISSATKSQDSTLTGWTTSIAAGDTLRFNVDSCTNIQRCTVSLKVTRT